MIRSGILRKIAVGTLGFCLSLSAGAGTITGTIKFEGEPPVMKELPVTADPACAAMHKDSPIVNEALVLGDGQTMANVLVVVTKGVPEK